MQGQFRGDFTRDAFHPAKHFSRVLIQQGRVQLDADWNEQTAILLHYLRSLAADLIGPHGGPACEGGAMANGFLVTLRKTLTSDGDFLIGHGHYYVNGTLCEFESPTFPFTAQGKDITLQTVGLKEANFKIGQYVEILDDGPTFAHDFFQIKNVGNNNNVLTLDIAPPTGYKIPKVRQVGTYKTQPDYQIADSSTIEKDALGQFLVYLDVWERHITYLEDGSCREVALGGADTATRAKVVWQVKTSGVTSGIPDSANALSDGDWRNYVSANLQLANRGLLKARVQTQTTSTDPCTISPASAYRGPENQLYRVEINNGGTPGTATFKWSRENGSVVFPIVELGTSSGQTTVTLANLGRDVRLGLKEGDWVEIVDDNAVLQNQAGTLLKVVLVDRSNLMVTLNGSASETFGSESTTHPLLRRWEQKVGDASTGGVPLAKDGAVTIVEGNWIPLEEGIQIQFQKGGTYRTADYWLIPARTATGDIQWPRIHNTQSAGQPLPDSLPPHGVEHYYAPLALVPANAGTANDLRRTFTTQAIG
jgi:hypothetical protein